MGAKPGDGKEVARLPMVLWNTEKFGPAGYGLLLAAV
jgi:hypothetical protein